MAREIRPDWWAKTSAGVILGYGLALSLTGLVLYLATGGAVATPASHYALLLRLEVFIWIMVFGLCFLFRSGLAAWVWLGGANLLAFAALLACRFWFFA